jgi:hypothetical protein
MSRGRKSRSVPPPAGLTPSVGPAGEVPRPARPLGGGFEPDYHHVVRDLRRIGFLAMGIFLFLLALSFVL